MWMEDLPDHPVIRSMERTGEPRPRGRRGGRGGARIDPAAGGLAMTPPCVTAPPRPPRVIANQSADWCGNPYPPEATERADCHGETRLAMTGEAGEEERRDGA